MFFLLTDETNLQASDHAKFFIYGGLIIPFSAVTEFNRRIIETRLEAGYLPQDEFKFDTRSRPVERVSIEAATNAKRNTIQACRDFGCLFIVCLIHHEIIWNRTISQAHLKLTGQVNNLAISRIRS